MIREDTYRRKFAWRGRGEDALQRHVGGIAAEIDAHLERRAPVRILELGCGYGTALLDLRARYGARIELHGLNRVPHDGDADVLLRNARERGILGPDAAPPPGWLPTLHYADVARGLPFPARSFDIVFSQVAWLYFGDKMAVLRNVVRVLDDGGVAKIDADELRAELPPEYRRLVEIWEGDRLLPFGDYLRRHDAALVSAPEGEYVRLGRSEGLGADLVLALEIDLAALNAHWDGVKCIYRLRGPA